MNLLIVDMRAHPVLFSIGCLGIVASFVLLVCSTGTNDITNWEKFATAIQSDGLGQLYADQKLFNHPPLMGIFAWLALEVSALLNLPFAFEPDSDWLPVKAVLEKPVKPEVLLKTIAEHI